MTDQPQALLPHDKEAEQGVLGSILHNNEAIYQASALIAPDSFFSPAHRHIFQAMIDMTGEQLPIDEITLITQLREVSKVDAVGGLTYVAELLDATPVTANVLVYADIVRSKAEARLFIIEATEAVATVRDQQKVTEEALALQGTIEELAGGTTALDPQQAGDVAAEVYKNLEQAVPAFPAFTHMKVDSVLGGFGTERPTVIAARTGVGKTSFGVQICLNNAQRGVPTLFISLEMEATTIISRAISNLSDIPGEVIMHRRLNELTNARWDRLTSEQSKLKDWPFYVLEPRRPMSPQQIEGTIRLAKIRYGVKLVIVDHLTRIQATGRDIYSRQTERIESLGKMQRRIGGLAMVVMVQLNREGDGTTPIMKHLKGSGDIEENAGAVLLLHDVSPESNEPMKPMQCIVAKNGNGRKGRTTLWFEPAHYRFNDQDMSQSDFEGNFSA